MALHIPVLLYPWLEHLHLVQGGVYVDATLGLAGHATALLDRADEQGIAVTLVGIDRDAEALTHARKRLESYGKRHTIHLIEGVFADISDHLKDLEIHGINGVLADIGVSSLQLDIAERGFSFRTEGPLDMRMSFQNSITAATIVNTWSEDKLVLLLRNYGEEHLARKIVRAITERRRKRPFTTTLDLAEVIRSQYPAAQQHRGIHPATRTFQALRIEVNQELHQLYDFLQVLPKLMLPGGIAAIMTFHSLEDRIVKQVFADFEVEYGWKKLTKKPIVADEAELAENSRSRSAKLRMMQVSPV
jgi:16S rRNA (cytosine1402-N4)-methyltransferase